MKKERKLKLEVNKVNVSKLNMIVAGGGETSVVGSIVLCELTTFCDTNIDGECKTYITATGSRDRC